MAIRLDARFFIAEARYLSGEFASNGELDYWRWVPIAAVDSLQMAPITAHVLKELARHLERPTGGRFYSRWLGRTWLVTYD